MKSFDLKGNHMLLKTEIYHSNGPVNATSKLTSRRINYPPL